MMERSVGTMDGSVIYRSPLSFSSFVSAFLIFLAGLYFPCRSRLFLLVNQPIDLSTKVPYYDRSAMLCAVFTSLHYRSCYSLSISHLFSDPFHLQYILLVQCFAIGMVSISLSIAYPRCRSSLYTPRHYCIHWFLLLCRS